MKISTTFAGSTTSITRTPNGTFTVDMNGQVSFDIPESKLLGFLHAQDNIRDQWILSMKETFTFRPEKNRLTIIKELRDLQTTMVSSLLEAKGIMEQVIALAEKHGPLERLAIIKDLKANTGRSLNDCKTIVDIMIPLK